MSEYFFCSPWKLGYEIQYLKHAKHTSSSQISTGIRSLEPYFSPMAANTATSFGSSQPAKNSADHLVMLFDAYLQLDFRKSKEDISFVV